VVVVVDGIALGVDPVEMMTLVVSTVVEVDTSMDVVEVDTSMDVFGEADTSMDVVGGIDTTRLLVIVPVLALVPTVPPTGLQSNSTSSHTYPTSQQVFPPAHLVSSGPQNTSHIGMLPSYPHGTPISQHPAPSGQRYCKEEGQLVP